MIFLNQILSKFWKWIVGVGAVLAGILAIYFKGKSEGKQEQILDTVFNNQELSKDLQEQADRVEVKTDEAFSEVESYESFDEIEEARRNGKTFKIDID